MDDAPPAFAFGARLELIVSTYRRALLSLPALDGDGQLAEKDLLRPGAPSVAAKFTLDQHLEHLVARGKVSCDCPLLALGLRNSLVNLRAPVIVAGEVYGVENEVPAESGRGYYGIGARGGQLSFGQALGDTGEDWRDADFFCAAPPVLWPGFDDAELLDALLIEAADHSHLFDLPRGNHPQATDVTRAAWAALHEAFTEHLYSKRETAVAAMRAALGVLIPTPQRCDDYLHAAVGVDATGALVCIYAHGRLESVGRLAHRRGARAAVCVENSGSISPTYLPGGASGERIPLLRAPNFRPFGRALLVIELDEPAFSSLAPLD
jgi:hypothetical protein